ncbi:MAG: hypothetical protein ACK4N4_09975, partial [Burkholderiales bacterium]
IPFVGLQLLALLIVIAWPALVTGSGTPKQTPAATMRLPAAADSPQQDGAPRADAPSQEDNAAEIERMLRESR